MNHKKASATATKMVYDALFNLPLELVIEVLSTWVDLRSLARTVSACCNVEMRSTLMLAFQSSEFVLNEKCCNNNKSPNTSLQWLCRYGIRSTSIAADPGCTLADYMKYVLKCGKFIKSIVFRNQDTTNPIFTSMAALHCVKLTTLVFGGCSLLGFVGDISKQSKALGQSQSAPILRMCSNLIHLNLPNCITLVDSHFMVLAEQCKNLKTLGLHNCRLLTDRALNRAAQLCPHVVNLDVSNCVGFTDTGINMAVVQFQKLRILNCIGCNITDSLLITVTAKLANTLTAIYLSGCANLTANYINMMLQFCNHIRTLSTDLHKPATLQLVSLNWRLFAHLTTVYVTCHHLADRALVPIAQHCRILQHLSVQFYTTSCVEGPLEVLLQCKCLRTLVIGVEYSTIVPIWQSIRPDVIITHDTSRLQYNPYSVEEE